MRHVVPIKLNTYLNKFLDKVPIHFSKSLQRLLCSDLLKWIILTQDYRWMKIDSSRFIK